MNKSLNERVCIWCMHDMQPFTHSLLHPFTWLNGYIFTTISTITIFFSLQKPSSTWFLKEWHALCIRFRVNIWFQFFLMIFFFFKNPYLLISYMRMAIDELLIDFFFNLTLKPKQIKKPLFSLIHFSISTRQFHRSKNVFFSRLESV